MKGIILVGGLGTRLEPMTRVINKHLLPVGQFPMVYYPLHSLVDAGIGDIMIVTGGSNPGEFLELLHSGSEFGLDHLYFTYQQQPLGIADALRATKHFVGDDRCIVILGDNILAGSIGPYVQRYRQQAEGARILLVEVPDPQRFGVPEFDEDGNILCIVEKPAQPPSEYAAIGVYMYDQLLWDILPALAMSDRGQYEITDIQNAYLQRGLLEYDVIDFGWSDAGTPNSLFRATTMMRESDFSAGVIE